MITANNYQSYFEKEEFEIFLKYSSLSLPVTFPYVPKAYEFEFCRQTFQKDPPLKELHELVKLGCSSNMLFREEAVLMLPVPVLLRDDEYLPKNENLRVLDLCAVPGMIFGFFQNSRSFDKKKLSPCELFT